MFLFQELRSDPAVKVRKTINSSTSRVPGEAPAVSEKVREEAKFRSAKTSRHGGVPLTRPETHLITGTATGSEQHTLRNSQTFP